MSVEPGHGNALDPLVERLARKIVEQVAEPGDDRERLMVGARRYVRAEEARARMTLAVLGRPSDTPQLEFAHSPNV